MQSETEQGHDAGKPEQGDSPSQSSRLVDVGSIRRYPRNPRRKVNPEYHRIKASIRAAGLDQPLVITQEPDAHDYLLHAGGNTRLQILQELFAETAEPRFRLVDCIVKPWSGESSILFAHLRENELRGGLSFIDKALAVFAAKAMLERELEVETLSLRQMEQLFRERGFGLSHSLISKMGYAVKTLWPVIPLALSAGLGRPQVERIRALARAASELWCHLGIGEESEFDAVFSELCRRHDGSEWETQLLHAALENELAVESERNHQVIHLALEARLAGKSFDHFLVEDTDPAAVLPDSIDGTDQNRAGGQETFQDLNPLQACREKEVTKAADRIEADSIKSGGSTHAREAAKGRLQAVPGQLDQRAVNHNQATLEPIHANDEIRFAPEETDLQSLRHRHWLCACQLAGQYGLEGVVTPLPELGLGFVLSDVPPMDHASSGGAKQQVMMTALWWQLASCSAITEAPRKAVLPHVRKRSVLHQALSAQDIELLLDMVGPPDPALMNRTLWQMLSPPDWQLYLKMLETCRTIGRHAGEYDLDLWMPCEEVENVVEQRS